MADFGPAPLAVDVYWDSYPGKKAHIWKLWGQSGWMQVAEAKLETPLSSHRQIIACYCDDHGRAIQTWLGDRIFDMRASLPTYMHQDPPEELPDLMEGLYWDFLGRCDMKSLRALEQAERKLDEAINAIEDEADLGLREVNAFIFNLRRERRAPDCSRERRAAIRKRIGDMEAMRPSLLKALGASVQSLRDNHDLFETDTYEGLSRHGRIDVLYTVRWTLQSRHMSKPINTSLWSEDRWAENLNPYGAWRTQHKTCVPDRILARGTKKALPTRERTETKAETEEAKPQSLIQPTSVVPRMADTVSAVIARKVRPLSQTLQSSSLPGWGHRERKRLVRQTMAERRKSHLSKLILSRIGYKNGQALKTALIALATDRQISTDDAIYLYKILSDVSE